MKCEYGLPKPRRPQNKLQDIQALQARLSQLESMLSKDQAQATNASGDNEPDQQYPPTATFTALSPPNTANNTDKGTLNVVSPLSNIFEDASMPYLETILATHVPYDANSARAQLLEAQLQRQCSS